MNLGLRTRLMFAGSVPFVLPIGAALFGLPSLAVAASAVAGSALVVAGVVVITASFERLRRKASESLLRAGIAGEDSSDKYAKRSPDGTGEIADAIVALGERYCVSRDTLVLRNKQFEATIQGLTAGLNATIKDVKLPAKAFVADSPWSDKNHALSTAVALMQSAFLSSQRRISTLLNIMNDVPEPLLVFDAKLNLQYMNLAAEQFLDSAANKNQKQPARSFFADPIQVEFGQYEGALAYKGSEVVQWLHQGRGGGCEGVAHTGDEFGTPVALSSMPASERKSQHAVVLLMRDISSAKRAELNTRQLHRRLTGQRLSQMVAKEAAPSMEVVRTQAVLLAQAAKQSGQRERFLPKVQRIIEEVNRHELVIQLLGWLGRLTTTEASEPEMVEIRLRAIVDDVTERLAHAFAERGNTLEVTGDAGWLIADENRLTIMMTGLLVHANVSMEQSKVTLELKRRSAVTANDEMSEVLIKYKSPKISQPLIDDIREPFRRVNSAVFDSSGKVGFLLGPAVAHRVAGLMSGELQFDHAEECVQIRVVLPTRERTENRIAFQAAAAVSMASGSMAPGSMDYESLGGWNVGGSAVEEEDAGETAIAGIGSFEDDTTPIEAIDDSIGAFFS